MGSERNYVAVSPERNPIYFDIKTDDLEGVFRVIREHAVSAEPVQITLNKRDGLYQLELLCKIEPLAGPTD